MTVYRPYTTQFDRVVNAAELPAVTMFKKLALSVSLKKYSKLIDGLQTEVVRFLEALPPDRIRTLESLAVNTAVTVLVDHSNSLKAHGNMKTAVCAIYTILFLLEKLRIRHEILGFTTQSWHGGESRKLWIKNNRPEKPGRLCDLLHIIYKSYDSDGKAHFKLILRNLLRPDLLKENVDGEALEWAAARLTSRDEQTKILIQVSDGAPVDDSTILANSEEYLREHLRSVIKAVEDDDKINLCGIGLHCRVNEYYPHSLQVDSAPEASRIVCNYVVDCLM